ncbi:hypothetical protein [Pantoea sp. CCBC3-3-1]|uniref:hypothetical protein n=1 Tax=Pantoea sp. CCBC3-3-1 TaxID=2490851 RepID=UPI0011BDD9E9|nr:hypothetical protein [Pantoea sp. CCBC3-3-1]
MDPSLSQVIIFVHQFSKAPLASVHEQTLLEADLGITGDDGVELIEAAEKIFRVDFCSTEQSFSTIFSLKENEYLFNSEGLDLLGICRLFDWIRGIPRPVIRDLSVGQLHRALVEACNVHLLEA